MNETKLKQKNGFDIERAKKTFNLSNEDIHEINNLIDILNKHIENYYCFKSFVKVSKDALQVAFALLNGDKKTFIKYQLKYTKHTAEKMRGIDSLSTYKKTSNICKFLSMHTHTGCICEKCYAEKSISLYNASLTPVLIYNTLLLKYIDIDISQIPYINSKYFRFEAFSDLQSSKHFANLLKVCKKNKNTIFTLWTKAGYNLRNMIEKENIKKLPANLNIIISEIYINKPTDKNYLQSLQTCLYPVQAVTGKYTNPLKCFIVYDDETKRNNANMYLCKNKCVDCLKCYKKSKDIIYIAEKLH